MLTDQNCENGLNDVFVETAYSPAQIVRAIDVEVKLGVRECPCVFAFCTRSGRDVDHMLDMKRE